MNKQGNGTVFKDPKKLYEMLELRKAGWTFPKLAEKYACDHSSIQYHVRKHKTKLPASIVYGQSLKVKTIFEETDALGEKVRNVKHYAYYKKQDELKRKKIEDRYMAQRLAEENRKSAFCKDESKVLIRVML